MRAILSFGIVSVLALLPLPAGAADGDHGHGHAQWHGEFYSKLLRPDTKTVNQR